MNKECDLLGIEYVWRDSCVKNLIELKKCVKIDVKATIPIIDRLSSCNGIQNLWKECEKKREFELMNVYFTKFDKLKEKILTDKD